MTNISKAMGGGRGSPTDSPTFKISMRISTKVRDKVRIGIKKPDRSEIGVHNKRNKFLRSIANSRLPPELQRNSP
jgi:hypothetical protein